MNPKKRLRLAEEKSADKTTRRTTPFRVLVVDNEQDMRYELAELLKHYDFEVETAQDGEDGLQKLRTSDFDLALIGLRMLGMDGLTLARHVEQENINTSIIILSGHSETDDVIAAIELQNTVIGWFEKSSNIDTLIKHIKLQQKVAELERREIEQRIALEEAKKLSDLGVMATGIAHNINNPVGIIRLAAQRGLRKLETGLDAETGREIFERILRQADRLHEIIAGFRDFANGNRQPRETVELNPLIAQMQEDFKNQLEAHHITLKLALSPENPRGHANRFVLREVLINLIQNAREALENTAEAFILIETWQHAEKVGFYVSDNGAGIPEPQRKNLFSPFHSTKAGNSGLGLYFAHKALAELHATIAYKDRQPNGAFFTIELLPAQEN